MIFLKRCTKSPKNNIKIFTYLFYTNHPGGPAGLKSISKIRLKKAWEEWDELQEHDWTEVSHASS